MNVTESKIIIDTEAEIAGLIKKTLGVKGHVTVFNHTEHQNVSVTIHMSPLLLRQQAGGLGRAYKPDTREDAALLLADIVSRFPRFDTVEGDLIDQKHSQPYSGWAVQFTMLTSKLRHLMDDMGVAKEYDAILKRSTTKIADMKKKQDGDKKKFEELLGTLISGVKIVDMFVSEDSLSIEFRPATNRELIESLLPKQFGIQGVSVDSSGMGNQVDRIHVDGRDSVMTFVAKAEALVKKPSKPVVQQQVHGNKLGIAEQ